MLKPIKGITCRLYNRRMMLVLNDNSKFGLQVLMISKAVSRDHENRRCVKKEIVTLTLEGAQQLKVGLQKLLTKVNITKGSRKDWK